MSRPSRHRPSTIQTTHPHWTLRWAGWISTIDLTWLHPAVRETKNSTRYLLHYSQCTSISTTKDNGIHGRSACREYHYLSHKYWNTTRYFPAILLPGSRMIFADTIKVHRWKTARLLLLVMIFLATKYCPRPATPRHLDFTKRIRIKPITSLKQQHAPRSWPVNLFEEHKECDLVVEHHGRQLHTHIRPFSHLRPMPVRPSYAKHNCTSPLHANTNFNLDRAPHQ
jgi:hypothetical protein